MYRFFKIFLIGTLLNYPLRSSEHVRNEILKNIFSDLWMLSEFTQLAEYDHSSSGSSSS